MDKKDNFLNDKLKRLYTQLDALELVKSTGKIEKIVGLTIIVNGLAAKIGDICKIINPVSNEIVFAEVVGFLNEKSILMPIGDVSGLGPDFEVVSTNQPLMVTVSPQLLGRVINGIGKPIDGKGIIYSEEKYPILNTSPDVLTRPRITEVLATGIKAIDGLFTIGKGQRIGIFSAAGVGKSTLLGMIAKNTYADINVIALIGERGREVREFIENELGEEGLKKSVVVVATSDQPPIVRLRSAFVATAIAEYFRDRGYDVNFMMDSITRFARAQRDVGLATGEPLTTRGYPPSVFEVLPKLLERIGTSEKGSITGIYNILVEADDIDEPISDNVRGIIDGHIVLSRKLAEKAHYPAINILDSLSRVMVFVTTEQHRAAAAKIRELVSAYRDKEELIDIGAYVRGSNLTVDEAIDKIDYINSFLKQTTTERFDFQETVQMIYDIVNMSTETVIQEEEAYNNPFTQLG